jgi:hypothetical protein
MEKIPTAEELIETSYFHLHLDTDSICLGSIRDAMIEFAKLHVEAALKEASENGQAFVNGNGEWISSNVTAFINKDSILNSYPLENIE